MSVSMVHNSYGKSRVRLTKVVRREGAGGGEGGGGGGEHELFEINADIQLEGDFEAAYMRGDNRLVVATDTIKNTVYVLAKENAFSSVEQFALILARHFLVTYPHVTKATVELAQEDWRRIRVGKGGGESHRHAFVSGGSHLHRATAVGTREGVVLTGGISGLRVIKTTESAWAEFHADRYRTLKDAHDRILGTTVEARWWYGDLGVDFGAAREAIVGAMLEVFATRFSPSAQQTLREMGEAALGACAGIEEVTIELPNQHRIPFNLEPFGLKFENDIFVTTDEPHGLIKGTVARGGVK